MVVFVWVPRYGYTIYVYNFMGIVVMVELLQRDFGFGFFLFEIRSNFFCFDVPLSEYSRVGVFLE